MEPSESAVTFWERWAPTLGESEDAREWSWVYILANCFKASAEALTRFRVQYESALEPAELVHVDALMDRLSSAERDLGKFAEDLDPSIEQTGIRKEMALGPDDVAHNVQNRCVQLGPYFADVAADYQGLTGVELTTQPGWESVALTRAMFEVVARRETPTDPEKD